MARRFRQHYTKPIPEGADVVTIKGKLHARFTEDGRTARSTPTSTPCGTATSRFGTGAGRP